ncbi:hypothetical protein [Bacteroides rodentium]
MNRHSLIKTILGATAILLLAACSQDDAFDGNTLPEGKYPLQISSVTLDAEVGEQPWSASHVPQTRVAENPDGNSSVWEWNGTEKIDVQLYADGDVATYTLNTGNTLSADKTLYWKNTQPTTVTAWYPTTETVSLMDQSSKLAYVLKASGLGTFDRPVTLDFTHSLAKVQVIPSGSDAGKVTGIMIWAYTSCTHTKGDDIKGSYENWITMMRVTRGEETVWEANVVPGYKIERVKVNGVETILTTPLIPSEAKVNTINLTVEKVTEINISDITETEYTVKGNVHLKGDGTTKDLKLTLTEGAKLKLENVNLDPSALGTVVTCEGSATITLVGTNTIKGENVNSKPSHAILITKGSLIINGDGSLYASGSSDAGAGIFASGGAEIIINGGQITAKGGTIDNNTQGAPGIGSENNGKITINGGTIHATGGPDAAGIGASWWATCGDILISGDNTVITAIAGKNVGGSGPSKIGAGNNGRCGTVTIKAGVTVNGRKYTQDETGEVR